MPEPEPAFTEEHLLGTWKLVSASSRDVESGAVTHAFGGPHPVGFISYGKDHRMMAVIAYDNRIKPVRLDQTTAEQRDQLFKTMAAYAGTYTVSGKSVQHHIDVSWNETWSGTSVTRDVTFEDGKLILRSRPLHPGRLPTKAAIGIVALGRTVRPVDLDLRRDA